MSDPLQGAAEYLLIRYVADPARSEALNVGILLWSGDEYRIRIDGRAVERVIRDNPHLARDSLLSLEAVLREQFTREGRLAATAVRHALAHQKGFPVVLTEPRYTAVGNNSPTALEDTMDRLIRRIVQPRRRSHGGGTNPAEQLASALRSMLKRQVIIRNHELPGSLSGIPRRVDFYLDGGRNIALDAVQFDLRKADEIRRRADAQAFKVWDVLEAASNALRYGVYCHFGQNDLLLDSKAHAEQVLSAAGAEVFQTVPEASRILVEAGDQT